jgi:CHAT domain-containing protein
LVAAAWFQWPDRRGATLSAAPPRSEILAARRALAQRQTTTALADDAVLALAAGAEARAIADLSAAAKLAPTDATLWSDLAASHLQAATAAGGAHELVPALEAATRALELDPALLAARFNQALALGHLGLWWQATTAWRHYLQDEREPHWSEEAAARLADLERAARPADWNADRAELERAVEHGDTEAVRATVARSPQRCREYTEELLIAWTRARTASSALVPDRLMAVARAISGALLALSGERMGADVVQEIDRLSQDAPSRLRPLTEAIRAYGVGLTLAKQGDFTRALPPLEKARDLLAAHRSSLARWATFWVAICHYQRGDYRRARADLLPLEKEGNPGRYPAVHGRALWLRGLIDSIEGSPTAALGALSSALADFDRLGEKANSARLGALVANELADLGQPVEAWRRLQPALSEVATFGLPENRSALVQLAAWLALDEGEMHAALWFQNEVVRSAQVSGAAYSVAEALRWRAAILAVLGRRDRAEADLEQAGRALELVPDPRVRRALAGDIALVRGELARTDAPANALRFLDAAIKVFRSTSDHYQISRALYERSLVERALGQTASEERDLAAAIAETEQQRERITVPEQRIAYFDRKRELLDTMVSFQLERRLDPQAAFIVSEEAKARMLWDWMRAQPADVRGPRSPIQADTRLIGLRELQVELPQKTAVVEYAVLPERTVIWVLHRGSLEHATVRVGAEQVVALVQALNRARSGGSRTEIDDRAARLYDLLVRPVVRSLVPGERLVLVPDGPLHALSFALLRDSQSRRYLIEDFPCSVAPSARVFVASLHRDAVFAQGHHPRALVVAAPDFDRELYPDLQSLTAVDQEAALAEVFPGSKLLRGSGAGRLAFLRAAGNYEVVHFGGHAIVNSRFPLLSQLLFARDPADPQRGVLFSGDLLRQRFPRTRLVVLASCATAAGRVSRTEGVESLARPFLASGVPAVIASLWQVDDLATADFFTIFYRRLKQGFDPVEALRAAQVECARNGSGAAAASHTWAAFEIIGASAVR